MPLTATYSENINNRHRFIIGGLFLTHGLIRVGLGCLILVAHTELFFSAVMILFAMAAPSLFGAYNLLTGNRSAHSILMIASLVNLFDFPYGTALSIYYYWFWKYQCGAPNPLRETQTLIDTDGADRA